MAARIGAMACHCCGEPESRGGCVRGLRCGCDATPRCDLCKKCDDHHVAECTEQLRSDFSLLMMQTAASFREKHRINIFGEPTNVERRAERYISRIDRGLGTRY